MPKEIRIPNGETGQFVEATPGANASSPSLSKGGPGGSRSRPLDSQLQLARIARSIMTKSCNRIGTFFTALIALNLFCMYCLPAQIDLTRHGDFTLAAQTRNLLVSLQEPVAVTLLVSRNPKTAGELHFRQAADMFRDLLENCRRAQPLVHIEEFDSVDSVAARDLQREFPDVAPPCIVMAYGRDKFRTHEVLYARDLADVRAADGERLAAIDFFGEQALASALSRLTSGRKQATLYVTVGHGELALADAGADSRRGLGQLAAQLGELDCELKPLDLSSAPRVPRDASLVLIAGGEKPWSESESEKLGTYLRQGGKALMLVDLNYDQRRDRPVPTGLEKLLSEFGVAVGNDRVITRGFTGEIEVASPALPAEGDHPLARSLPQSPLTLFECRSLWTSTGLKQLATKVSPLLVSHAAPRAWADGDFNRQRPPEPGGKNDTDGPVVMAVAVERRQGDNVQPALVVVGDAEFVSNRVVSQPDGRADLSFVLSCVNWLRGRRELLGDIAPRRHEAARLAGSPDDHRGLVWKSSLILWSLIATAGLTVWTTRRMG